MVKNLLSAVISCLFVFGFVSCRNITGTSNPDPGDEQHKTAYSIILDASMVNGTIIVQEEAEVGEKVSLSINANSGYLFVEGSLSVTKDAGGSVGLDWDGFYYSFIMPASDVTIHAEFEESPYPTYNVYFKTSGGGSVRVNASPVPENTMLQLTIEANAHWELESIIVTKDDNGEEVELTGAGATRTFSMPDSDVTVNTVFVQILYNITIDALSNGSISASEVKAAMDTIITLTVDPDKNFALKPGSLEVNNGTVLVNGSGNLYDFIMPASDVAVTALFVDTRNSITSFSINDKAGDIDQDARTIIIDLDYSAGLNKAKLSPVIVLDSELAVVTPASGVSVDLIKPVEYTVKSQSGETRKYKVTVRVSGKITIDPEMEKGTVTAQERAYEGETVNLTIIADSGYLLRQGSLSVTKDGGGNVDLEQNASSFIMPAADVTIKAAFDISTIPTYNIIVGTITGGSVRTNLLTVAAGTTITLTITADFRRELESITVTNITTGGTVPLSGTGNTRTFTMPESNVTVEAVFKVLPNEDPVAADYTVSDFEQIYGSTKAVIITPKEDKSPGARTIYYEGTDGTTYTISQTVPVNAGKYSVTFDVAAATGWNAVTGLSAGILTIKPKVMNFTIPGISAQTYNGSARTPAVTVRDGNTTLTLNTHYNNVTYSNNINAGTASVTVTGIGNYAGSTGNANFTINKAAGANVSAPTVLSVTLNSITVNLVTASTGQDVQYAINTSTTVPTSGWQASNTFTDLNANSKYYVFARSVANNNYEQGTTASCSQVITTATTIKPVFEYYWVNEHDSLVTTSGGSTTIAKNQTLTITAQAPGYTVTEWRLNGTKIIGPVENTYSFSSSFAGKHTIGLFVTKDGKLYNTNIVVTVQ